MDYKLGRTKAPPVDKSVVLVNCLSPLSLIMRLMIDQVRSLNNRGVSAAILSSNKGIDKDLVATAKELSSGKHFLLYTAPEAVVEDHCWRIHFLLYQESIYEKTTPRSRPNTINTRPSRRPSVQLETDRPGVEATWPPAHAQLEKAIQSNSGHGKNGY